MTRAERGMALDADGGQSTQTIILHWKVAFTIADRLTFFDHRDLGLALHTVKPGIFAKLQETTFGDQ
jgi:hypothetical protein